MRTIALTQGKVALVDDADYEAVNAHKWYAKKIGRGWYAMRGVRRFDGKWITQSLHQFLMPGVSEIDHRDGNGLNNQRENIRPSTRQQNQQRFRSKPVGATSKFRGVSWHKGNRRWEASIKVDGKNIYLGNSTIEEDAARIRDKATLKYYGPDAHFNFPQ